MSEKQEYDLLDAFNDAQVPLRAIGQRAQRFLVVRSVVSRDGFGKIFKLDHHGPIVEPAFVCLGHV